MWKVPVANRMAQTQALLHSPGFRTTQLVCQFLRLLVDEKQAWLLPQPRICRHRLLLGMVHCATARSAVHQSQGDVCLGLLHHDIPSSCPGQFLAFHRCPSSLTVVRLQIVLSHFGQSTEDLGPVESFPHRQLRTTMDVDCPTYLDWMHGGLHMQVAHHLFPRVPRHNLRQVNTLVRAYASKFQHLGTAQYETHSFVKGNKKVLGVLAGVAEQVSALSQVAEANVAAKAQQLRADLKH